MPAWRPPRRGVTMREPVRRGKAGRTAVVTERSQVASSPIDGEAIARPMNAFRWLMLVLIAAQSAAGADSRGTFSERGGMPYEAFTELPASRLEIGGGEI